MAEPEEIRQPQFEFFDDTAQPVVDEMRALEQGINTDPVKHRDGIRILSIGTATVRRVIDFVDAHPDGSATLRQWADALDRRSDIEVSFDPDSEAASEKDSQIIQLKNAPRLTAEERSEAIRRRRLTLFAERMQTFRKVQSDKEQNPAA